MSDFKELIASANVLVVDKKYKVAIDIFKEALIKTEIPEYKIDILNTIGRLFLSLQDAQNAIKSFEESINIHNNLSSDKATALQLNKATVLNNLGALTVKREPKTAIKYHKEALDIFTNNPNTSVLQLANTHYSYADASYGKGDFYMAKKQYKDAITKYESVKDTDDLLPFIANSYYNLGNIYTDENNVYDARNNYLKGLKIYRKLSEIQPKAFKSLVAATFNNLAVTAKTMYKYGDAITYYENALKEYKDLLEIDYKTFLPFYTGTLNNIGIIYSEQHEVKDDYDSFGLTGFSGFGTLSTDNSIDNKEQKQKLEEFRKNKALEYYTQAIEKYNELVVSEPELYSHYLATTHHNLGVLYDTKGDYKKAEESFEKALFIRRDLAKQQPNAFNLDVCVTLFNIVTMYQNLLEQTVNIDFKESSLKILDEITIRMEAYKEDKRPVVESMRSDLTYFKNYFKRINEEYLDIFDAIVKENAVIEKINETFKPSEKLQMQKHVINLYYLLFEKYPNNPRLQDVLLNSYIKYSWFALRSNELAVAEKALDNGFNINKESLNLKTNQAFLFLLKNNTEKSKKLFNSLKDLKNEENKPYKQVIEEDFTVLKRDGLLERYSFEDLF